MVFNKKCKERKKYGNENGKKSRRYRVLNIQDLYLIEKKIHGADKELKVKGRMAANKVWGLRERICGNNFGRRWRLFKYFVTSVMAYRVKIWEWEEQKNLEKIMLNYVR